MIAVRNLKIRPTTISSPLCPKRTRRTRMCRPRRRPIPGRSLTYSRRWRTRTASTCTRPRRRTFCSTKSTPEWLLARSRARPTRWPPPPRTPNSSSSLPSPSTIPFVWRRRTWPRGRSTVIWTTPSKANLVVYRLVIRIPICTADTLPVEFVWHANIYFLVSLAKLQ